MSDFKTVSKAEPCPVCGKPDWCARMGDGSRVKCERLVDPPPGWHLLAAKDGGGVFAADDAPPEATTGTWKPAKRLQAAAPLETGDAGKKRPGGYGTAAELVKAAYGQRGPAAGRWAYRDAAEKPVGVVLRFEEAGGGKTYRQASRCPVDGLWRAEAMPGPRPLYRLPELLAADPALPVDVVEGEKAADAGAVAGLVTTTAAGGSGAPVSKTDWAPLRGRRVRVLADHDAPGRKWAARVADHLGDVAADVRVVHLADRWADLPPGGDLVDALEREADPGAVRAAVEALAAEAAGPPEPEPLPPPLLPVPPFDPAWLPVAVRAWCVDLADSRQCPLDFTAVGSLLAMAGALGARLEMRPKARDGWGVVPNLWGAAVGRPSAMKTPALAPALSLLEGLEKATRAKGEEEKKAAARAQRAYLAKKKVLEKRLNDAAAGKPRAKGEEVEAEADVLDELDALEPPAAPPERCVVTQDATPEALHVLCGDNPEGITLFVDELTGLIANTKKAGREQERPFLLSGWNGNRGHTMNRVGRGRVHAESVVLTIAGGIQPGPLSVLTAEAGGKGAGADGLLQRFQLMTYPDLAPDWKLVDRHGDAAAFEAAQAVYVRLWNGEAVERAVGPITAEAAEKAGRPHLRFCAEAQPLWDAWYTATMTRARSGEADEIMESWLGKAGSMVASLALLLHVADLPPGGAATVGVSLDALERAVAMAGYFEAHARRVLLSGRRDAVEGAERILKELAAGSLPERFRARAMARKGWTGLKTVEQAAPALELLVDHGHLLEEEEPATAKGGRPTVSYLWRRPRPRPRTPGTPPTKPTQPPAGGGSVGSVGRSPGGGVAKNTPEPPPAAPGIGEAVRL